MVQAVLAFAVLLGGAVAPVAAAPDGGILGGDTLGSNTTDTVAETANDTVGATTDAVAETANDTVGSDAPGAVEETTNDSVGSNATGAVEETVDDTVAEESVSGAAETEAADPATGAAAPAAGDELERSIGTGVLPVGTLPVDQLPGTGDEAPVEPEDSPYGSEADGRLDACELPVRSEDLPLEQVPGPADLPVRLNVPGVPLELLGPETVAQLGLGLPPRPCSVYDPHDPSVDPTDPPADSWAVAELTSVDAGPDGVETSGAARGVLERGGAGGVALGGVAADGEHVAAGERFKLTDGATDKYLYLEGLGVVLVQERVVRGDLSVAVVGKNFGVAARCPLQNASAPSPEEPTGPCEYEQRGLPSTVTAEQIVDIVRNPPSDPPVEPREN